MLTLILNGKHGLISQEAVTQYLNAHAGAYQGKPSQGSPALPGVFEVGS